MIVPMPPASLNFAEAFEIGDRFWALGKVLQDDPKHTKPPHRVLTFRYSIRAMLARILIVDREYRSLNQTGQGTSTEDTMRTQKDRNHWNMVWESYAGVLFFAMDSSIECFTHALNAMGYLLKPADFIDITNDNKLKQVSLANLLDPPKPNANKPAFATCQNLFPKICRHWSFHRGLISQIIEYHDASKHRHSVVIGHTPGFHFLKPDPKQAMDKAAFKVGMTQTVVAPDYNLTVQTLTTDYQAFMIGWLRTAREEVETIFNLPFQKLPIDT